MKQNRNLSENCFRGFRREGLNRIVGLSMLLAVLSVAFTGCGDRLGDDLARKGVVRSKRSQAEPISGENPNEQHWDVSHSVMPVSTGGRSSHGTRLASFMSRSPQPVQIDLGGFDPGRSEAADDRAAVRLVQVNGDVEVVPTPAGQPDVPAEIIPTPEGTPVKPSGRVRPIARLAADVETTKPGQRTASIESQISGEERAGQPTLIDPNAEPGLVATENGPEDFTKWPVPEAVLFVTGDQHGYIEPCGCTGLEKQKGGVARRMSFLQQLQQRGWGVVPIDAGNQIRRIGQQATIKFEKSADALSQMAYKSVGLGPGDMRLSATDLISVTYAETPADAMFVSGNVVLIDPEFLPTHKIVRQGELKIGITSILDPDALEAPVSSDVTIAPIKDSAAKVLGEMNGAGASFRVLTFYGEEDVAKQLMKDVSGYDLIVVSGGYGEPTYRPIEIEGSSAQMIVTGNKGMFVGLVGLYQNGPMKYARVPLTHEYKDAPEMRKLMADYQQQLEQLGLSGLGLSPIPHPSGETFVGTAVCAKCHTSANEVWESSPHAEATTHIVEPTEGRGDVPRHFDPECISCHVTGWNAQNYYPYKSGYLSLEKSAHLTGSGCENCHGPGASHSAAEEENSGVSEERKKTLRLAMQLPLEKAKEHCMTCHDLDNSPDFHETDAFEDEYWPQVEHYGMD